MAFPCGSAGKESACNVGDLGLIPGLGRSPGEGNGCPLQYSGEFHGLYSPWGRKESDTTEWLSLWLYFLEPSFFLTSGFRVVIWARKQDPVETDLKPQGERSKASTVWASTMIFVTLAEWASMPSFYEETHTRRKSLYSQVSWLVSSRLRIRQAGSELIYRYLYYPIDNTNTTGSFLFF